MGFIGADGKFYSGRPKMADITPQKTSVWKQSDHDRQRQDHRRDLIHPYNRDGTPNQDFIDQYPEESKHVYKFIPTDEEQAKEQ